MTRDGAVSSSIPLPPAPADGHTARLRWQIYTLLILLSGGLLFGRIMAVDNVADRAVQDERISRIPRQLAEKQKKLIQTGADSATIRRELKRTAASLLTDAKKARPTLSANDRSRWLTIRALVEPESRVWRYIPLAADNGPCSADRLRRNCSCPCPQQAARGNLPEGEYIRCPVPYAIDKAMETPGWDTIDMVKHGLPDEEFDPANPLSGYLYSSKPPLLPTLMAGPYWLLNRCFGLSLRTNPFPTVRILLVIYNLIPFLLAWFLIAAMVDRVGQSDWGRILAVATACFATFLSTFVVTLNNHLPGVVCVVLALYGVFRVFILKDERLRWFVIAGFMGTLALTCELPAAALTAVLALALVSRFPRKTLLAAVPCGLLVLIAFFGTNYLAHQTFVPAYAMKRDRNERQVESVPTPAPAQALPLTYDPNDWYIYQFIPSGRERIVANARQSYWSNRVGIDQGEPSRLTYFLHATIGHHGVFSLSPIWLLSMAGLVIALVRGSPFWRKYAVVTLSLTLIFFLFYLSRGQDDRNYGGMTCGLRWFFPLIPLWIPAMLPALDRLDRSRWGHALALTLLFFSAMSVSWPLWNPWVHPWLYHGLIDLGWIHPF